MNDNFSLTDALLESVLPNNLISVEGEESLAAKVVPYISDAQLWLQQELLGDAAGELDDTVSQLAMRAVIMKAVISSIPALDLVVTPSGFGVVSSSSVAPASKERVERLINTLSTDLDNILVSLFELLRLNKDWQESRIAQELCATVYTMREARAAKLPGDIFDRFRFLRETAVEIGARLATDYLGNRLMRAISHDTHFGESAVPSGLRIPLLVIFDDAVSHRKDSRQFPDVFVMNGARIICDRLPHFPEYYTLWRDEMCCSVNQPSRTQSRPGAYCF